MNDRIFTFIRRVIFLPITIIYWLLILIRNFLYDAHILKTKRLNGKTISIGNIEAGGTGKTPMVLAVAQSLKASGLHPAVLTRGYRSGLKSSDWLLLMNGQTVVGKVGHFADEARMLSNLLPEVPVIVGARRFVAAENALKHLQKSPTHWILDDGFQHRQIDRDQNILLLPREPRLGLLDLIPSGNFREMLSAKSRATMIIDSRNYPAASTELIQKVRGPSHQFFCAACAIARPERFFDTCKELKLECRTLISKRDHSRFFESDFSDLDPNAAIVTTEKDFYRDLDLWPKLNRAIFVIQYRFSIAFDKAL